MTGAVPAQSYHRLPKGIHGLEPEVVRQDQRERLRAAMVELIAAKGYPAVRISDLVRLAHVSPPTLYGLYQDKEQLFLGVYDEVAGQVRGAIVEAYAGAADPTQRLDAATRAFAEQATADPRAVSLLVLGAFGAGPNALERRRLTLEELEGLVGATLGDPAPRETGNLTVKAIVGGMREVAAARLREGRQEELPGLAGTLSAWAGCYPPRLPDGLAAPAPRPGNAAAWLRGSERARRAEGRLPSGRSDLPRKAIVKSQRERIVDATAAIVAEKGLAGLTIPEIARRANVSNQTFYSIYPSKQDAFLGAQKVGLHQALRVCADAYETERGDWPRAIAAGIAALLEFLAAEPAHAKLSLVQMYGAGPEAIAVRDASMRGFAAYLHPGAEFCKRPLEAPEIVAEAVVGGVWQILHHYIEKDSADVLPGVGPQLTYFALAPFIGSEAAADTARRAGVGATRR